MNGVSGWQTYAVCVMAPAGSCDDCYAIAGYDPATWICDDAYNAWLNVGVAGNAQYAVAARERNTIDGNPAWFPLDGRGVDPNTYLARIADTYYRRLAG